MFQLFHKAEKKKSFDAVVKDEKRKNTESWYNDIFEKVASVYLNLPVTENEMTRKYPGEILCENIAAVPENIDLEVAMSLFRKDGVATIRVAYSWSIVQRRWLLRVKINIFGIRFSYNY